MPESSIVSPAVRVATEAMATRFEIALFGTRGDHLHAAGEAALDEVRRWHARLSAFDNASDVSRINREGARGWVRCDDELFELLSLSRSLMIDTCGAFDIALGPAMRAAGFRGAERDTERLARAAALAGLGAWELDAGARAIRLCREGVGLDLGAIGKGWALDRAADVLVEAGVTGALLHGGTSSVRALHGGNGAPPGFTIALGREAGAPTIELRHAALGVSGAHGRTVDGHGHVLDPRSGASAASRGIRAVRIDASTGPHPAARADAWSTAYAVLGAAPPVPPAGVEFLL